MTTALVFAYHDVGVRCLQVLLAHRIRVSLVVTHEDAATENIWFGSVATLARSHGIPVTSPEDPHASGLVLAAAERKPDFLFSFYYRQMLRPSFLAAPRLGALNMHGSLLPKYRGRAPVNWAVIQGERETGATLHYMEAKPDAGDIVDQQAVPIDLDDTALDVFRKVTAAAGTVLHRSLEGLVAGTAPRVAQDVTQASYFGRRTPEDGRIDWNKPAVQIHNLVRGVAPPYPGAMTTIAGEPARILRTALEPAVSPPPASGPCLFFNNGNCYARCGDARVLRVAEMDWRGTVLDLHRISQALGQDTLPLGELSLESS